MRLKSQSTRICSDFCLCSCCVCSSKSTCHCYPYLSTRNKNTLRQVCILPACYIVERGIFIQVQAFGIGYRYRLHCHTRVITWNFMAAAELQRQQVHRCKRRSTALFSSENMHHRNRQFIHLNSMSCRRQQI